MRIIAGKYRNKYINEPYNEKTRPTGSKLREAVFNILDNLSVPNDKTFVDLFAGSGSVGFEALSRGFGHVIWIEKDRGNFNQIIKTAQEFRLADTDFEIYNTDALLALKKLAARKGEMGVIFVDPPYKLGIVQKTIDTMIKLDILGNQPVLIEKSVEEPLSLPDGIEPRIYDYGDKQIVVISTAN